MKAQCQMLTVMQMKHTKEYKTSAQISLTYSYKSIFRLITNGSLNKYGIKYTLQTQLSFF